MNETTFFTNHIYESLSKDLINLFSQHHTKIWKAIFFTYIVAPFVTVYLLYISGLCLKAYRYYYKINGYTFTPDCWKPARVLMAYLLDFHGRFWHGYELEGMENIPKDGPALIVFHHGGIIPVDFFYLNAKVIFDQNRLICIVADRFLFHLPAMDAFIDCIQLYSGPVDTCVDILKKGNLLAVAPGGGREALFGDENYPILWGSRIGFAKVAMEAKVPIIPVFTENIREAFSTPSWGRKWLRGLYERTRLPVVPVYGGLPVKLKTIVGQPVEYDPSLTPQELAERVKERMQSMIVKHQKLPGNVTRSVIERFQHIFKFKQS